MNSNGLLYAGIGGVLISKAHKTKFIFSGPTQSSSPYETELEALVPLLGQIVDSPYKLAQIAILSDSRKLVCNVNNFRFEASSNNIWIRVASLYTS